MYQRLATTVSGFSSGRKTALALIFAIIFAEMLLGGQAQAIWSALWQPTQPLGKGNKA